MKEFESEEKVLSSFIDFVKLTLLLKTQKIEGKKFDEEKTIKKIDDRLEPLNRCKDEFISVLREYCTAKGKEKREIILSNLRKLENETVN